MSRLSSWSDWIFVYQINKALGKKGGRLDIFLTLSPLNKMMDNSFTFDHPKAWFWGFFTSFVEKLKKKYIFTFSNSPDPDQKAPVWNYNIDSGSKGFIKLFISPWISLFRHTVLFITFKYFWNIASCQGKCDFIEKRCFSLLQRNNNRAYAYY